MPFSPSSGRPTWTARTTPAMAPSVFAAYTLPMAASPAPRRRSAPVSSGSVMPAQNVAGSITSPAIACPDALNSR
ncbi:MAG: hypothetical protein E6H44_09040 [Betaproteobacteria bacterium]|nr:MAG: hypothetical protein E6H44_09040 [Betaproteobacteria bacterium]